MCVCVCQISRTIHNRVSRGRVVLGLRAELASEELEHVCAGKQMSARGVSNACKDRGGPTRGCGAHSGGRSSAFARSTLLTTLVLMPLPRPSICGRRVGCGCQLDSACVSLMSHEAVPAIRAAAFQGLTRQQDDARRQANAQWTRSQM